MTDASRLDELHGGFRSTLLDHEQLSRQVQAWAEAFPDLVRLESLLDTPGGRELWLLTIGPEPDRRRPAVWMDGNMHASELAGTSVALAVAEDVLRLHLAPDEPSHGLPQHVRETLRGVVFHILPRMAPDGAEAVLREGRYVRSVPRDRREGRQHARWIARDIDGDGVCMVMRKADPTGELVEARERPGVLVPRRLEDGGQPYKVYPEGVIEHWDGVSVPDPFYLADNSPDLNRNFPYSWAPEHSQVGAGPAAVSEPESRAVVDFAIAHPEIFAWANLHTFGGVFIRPRFDVADPAMDPSDLALYRQLEAWAEEHTGYPTVSSYEQFTYEPDKPLHGSLSEFAYHQRGCLSYVCELWDFFEQVGLEKKKRFVERYQRLSRADLLSIAAWDEEHNGGRILRPWRAAEHPQLGAVEVGGVDPRFGIWNPPPERLPEICAGQSAVFLRVAAMAPKVVARSSVHRLGDGLCRVELTVENHGYLPTYVLASAKHLQDNEPLWAEASARGCELTDPDDARREIGHLDGWGRGRGDGTGSTFYLRTRGSTGRRTVRWTVRGEGVLDVRVGSCRVGWTDHRVEV